MFKNILRLLAASTSFVALLLITNSAIALTSIDNSVSQVQPATISLNLVSPSLNTGISNTLSNHLGCSCAACVQNIQQSNSQI